MKYKIIYLVFVVTCFGWGHSQETSEREYRIKRSEFPLIAYEFVKTEISNVKKLRFYKERDSARTLYKAKFKKAKLYYSLEFDATGGLNNIEVLITRVDIPDDSFSVIQNYLGKNISAYKIHKISQQYLVSDETPLKTTIKNAFQNLIIPSLNYELVISAKSKKGRKEYEILFDSEGNFIRMRELEAPNYDHVLY
jgi:hypothetical protein